VHQVAMQVPWRDRKDAKNVIPDSSTRANTHLIPEVRPYTGQRVALFKNAPGVFVLAAGRFALLPMSPAFQVASSLRLRTMRSLFHYGR